MTHIYEIDVEKTSDKMNEAEWVITFSGLRHAYRSVEFLNFSIDQDPARNIMIVGDGSYAESTVLRPGFVFPLFNLTIHNDSSPFRLYWDGQDLGSFNLSDFGIDQSQKLKSALEATSIIDYALVEEFHTEADYSLTPAEHYHRRFLVLAVPDLKSLANHNVSRYENATSEAIVEYLTDYNGNKSEHFTWSGLTSGNIAVNIFHNDTVLSQVITNDGGSLSLSLGELGCYESTAGVFCSGRSDALSYGSREWPDVEYSTTISEIARSPGEEIVASTIESLKSINKVVVTKQDMGQSITPAGLYAIQGTTWDITFVRASYNSMLSAATDANPFTWSSDYSKSFYGLNVGVPGGTVSTERFDLPTLVVNREQIAAGWIAVVNDKVQGEEISDGQTVPVEVTMNGQEFSKQGVQFDYILQPTVTKVVPNHGPMTGGTEVIVSGTDFIHSSNLVCIFGDTEEYIVRVVTYFNSTSILCVSPPSRNYRKTIVKVSNNGKISKDDIAQSSTVFVYDSSIKLKSVTPTNGPMSGNFSVKVSGGPFNDTSELCCKFGLIAVQAFYVDEGLIQCWAPPHPAGQYPFEVTGNDQDYTTSRLPFFFYRDPELSRIDPVSGPARVAGTSVNIYGSGFINTTSLTCRFGRTNTKAYYVSSNYIVCPSPQLDEGLSGGMTWTALSEQFNRVRDPKYQNTIFGEGQRAEALFPGAYFYPLYLSRLVTVEISNNNQDFTDSGINFLYQQDAFVESILPSSDR